MRIKQRIRSSYIGCCMIGIIGLLASSCAAPGPYIGTDGSGPGPTNGGASGWILPVCSGESGITDQFGGYVGKIGGGDLMGAGNPQGLIPSTGSLSAFTLAYAQDANYNDVTAGLNAGVGAGGYWMLAGPGAYNNITISDMPLDIASQFQVLPSFAKSMSLAWQWGYVQGLDAIDDWIAVIEPLVPLNFSFIWADIEKSSMTFIWRDGTSHIDLNNYWDMGTGVSDHQSNRDVWDGFYSGVYGVVQSQTMVQLQGMYSSPGWWDQIASGVNSISNPEWTSQGEFANGPPGQGTCPTSFSSSPSAQFFGGQPSDGSGSDSIMWQWIETTNGPGDYDFFQYSNVIDCEASASNLRDCT